MPDAALMRGVRNVTVMAAVEAPLVRLGPWSSWSTFSRACYEPLCSSVGRGRHFGACALRIDGLDTSPLGRASLGRWGDK